MAVATTSSFATMPSTAEVPPVTARSKSATGGFHGRVRPHASQSAIAPSRSASPSSTTGTASPVVTGALLAADRAVDLDRVARPEPEDHDAVVLVGAADEPAAGAADVRRSGPPLPAQPLVEGVTSGAEGAELVVAPDDLADLLHDQRPDALAVSGRVGGDGLDVARAEGPALDLEHPDDDRCVRHDLLAVEGDGMPAAEPVVPVVVAEVVERHVHQRAGLLE